MGLFNKIAKGMTGIDVEGAMAMAREATAGPDGEVMQLGRPAQAVILQVQPLGSTVSVGNGLVERMCIFAVRITMDDVPPYEVQVKQRIAEIYLGQIQPGSTVIGAKVHPQDGQRVVLDFSAPPPSVRYTGGDPTHTAAYVLATGTPAEAVIVSTQSLNMTNQSGVPMHAFVLTVIPEDGRDPYQAKVGIPVPPSALPLVFPGSKVPVRINPSNPNSVVVDWENASRR